MSNEIIDGISVTLNQTYGDEVKIYSEEVKQGLKCPCFMINVLRVTQKRLVGMRRERTHSLDVQFFPSGDEVANQENQNVANMMYELLECVTLLNGEKIIAFTMNHEVVDGVLHFFVDYKVVYQIIRSKADEMGTIEYRNKLKGW